MLRKREKPISCCFVDTVKRCLNRSHCNNLIAPLSKRGQTGRIKICKVTGDRATCGRIAAMGVYPGIEADIICSGEGSRCILRVNGGTVSLDADVSQNILVTNL
ncbi:MAG: ferrous iron transport protein A [Proteobacteria bacterium]|nr:ferrous iron transport protein A [Pseudomonadota bacterium]